MDHMGHDDVLYEQEPKEKKFRFWFLAGSAAVLVIILIAGAVLLIHSGVKTQKYNSLVKSGNNYYSAGDYQNAIVEYQKALAVDDSQPGVYLNISYAYTALGDYDSAAEILDQGMDCIISEDLKKRLAEIQLLVNTDFPDANTVLLSKEEIETASLDVTTENTTFDMIAAYTYTEYFRDFGAPVSNTKSGNTVTLYYSSMGFYTTWYDLDNEKVLDIAGDMPVATAKPCSVRFHSLKSLFGSGEETFAVSKSKLAELFGDHVEFYQEDSGEKYYMTAQFKGCRLTIETNSEGDIVSESAWNKIEPLYRKGIGDEEEAEEEGQVSGYVLDAVTGKGMTAAMKVRNRGVRTGNALGELKSGADGSYTYSGKPGDYTIEVCADGYVTEYLDVQMIKGQVKTGMNIVLSPSVVAGEIRIVLTWGPYPSDLDSHTDGTSSAGGSFHIDFTNQTVNGVGMLDVDDRNGCGPETTTVTDTGADFTFSVYDFTQSGNMNASNAVVKVYLAGDSEPVTYTVPGGSGNTWTVFRYSNGTITPVNTMN